jgi:translation initiation factor 3 subunit F
MMAEPAVVPSGTKHFNVFQLAATRPYQRVQMHPLVVVAICDAYARRPEGATRSIGTLLGYVADGNVIEITDAFTVSHKDEADGRVMMDQEYHRKMLRLKRKVSLKESVVGWFSTGNEIRPSSIVIHSFYQGKDAVFSPAPALPSPLHVIVDTDCKDAKLTVKCYVNMPTPGLDTLVQFHEVPLVIQNSPESGMSLLPSVYNEEEKDGKKTGFDDGIASLLVKLRKAEAFSKNVVDGSQKVDMTDAPLAREFSQALTAAEPVFGVDAFEQRCASTVQDTLMCVYLSNLVRSQTALAEKINALTATTDIDA